MSEWTNHPEFPIYPVGDMQGHQPTFGMGLRQHYAGLAMQGWLARCANAPHHAKLEPSAVAYVAVEMADALIAELSKEQSND